MEPRRVAQSLSVLTRQLGMPAPGSIEGVMGVWGEAAGRLAVESEPISIRRGRLVVMTDDPSVAEALEWQAGTICARIASLVPDLGIDGIDVRMGRP